MRPLIALALLTSLAVPGSVSLTAAGTPTRMLRTPSISATHVAFAYANNIWVVERAGGDARRLTSFQGQTSNPKILARRHDRRLQRANTPATPTSTSCRSSGGEPKRLTWHPGADTVQGWTPDGTRCMFASGARDVGAERDAAILDRAGQGRHRRADAAAARLSGKDLARRPPHRLSHEHFVGRGAPQLSRRPEPPDLDRRPQDVRSRLAAVDRFEGRRSGVAGRHRLLHLRSRRHRQRVVVRHRARKALTQRTRFIDFDVKSLDAGGGAVVFEQAGCMHALDPKSEQDRAADDQRGRRLPVDDAALRRRHDAHDATSACRRPASACVAEARGEIFTIPAEKGDVRNITNSSGSAERQPAWSPDGKWISYFSDKSGEYKLVIESQDGIGDAARDRVPEGGVLLHAGRGRPTRRSCSTPTPTSTCG